MLALILMAASSSREVVVFADVAYARSGIVFER